MKTTFRRLFMALLLACACVNCAEAQEKMALVTGNGLNFRSAPNAKGKKLYSFYKGKLLKILGTTGDWMKVEGRNKDVGYVNAAYVKMLTSSPIPDGLVKTGDEYYAMGPVDQIRFEGYARFETKGDYVMITTEWMRYDPDMGRDLPAENYTVVALKKGGKLIEKYVTSWDFDWDAWNNASVSVESMVKNGKLEPIKVYDGNYNEVEYKEEDHVIFYNAEMKLFGINGVAYCAN